MRKYVLTVFIIKFQMDSRDKGKIKAQKEEEMLINIYLISRWGEPAEHKDMKPDLEQDLVIDYFQCLWAAGKGRT